MIKKTCLIIVVLCSSISWGNHPVGWTESKMEDSNFKLKQLIEKNDAIITGSLQWKHADSRGRHYLIKNAVVLKGDLGENNTFIVVPHGRSSSVFVSGFYASGSFDKSSYLFFLKKWDRDEKCYEELYVGEGMTGTPYRINGVTYGPYGIIPLEDGAHLIDSSAELASLENKEQVDEDFLQKVTINKNLSEDNVKRFIKFYRQRYEELAEKYDAEDLRRMKRETKKVNDSLKAIKKLYGIDVPEEKNTFIAALKLIINDKEPDEETPKDVREMVKKLKSVNWSESKEPRSHSVLDDGGKDDDQSGLDLSIESD